MAESNYRNGFPDSETKVGGTSTKQGGNNSNLVFDDEEAVLVSYSLPEHGPKNVSVGSKIFAELSSFASFFGKNVLPPAASAALGQSAEYIKGAFSQHVPSEATSEESTASAKTYGQMGLRLAETVVVKGLLPGATLYAEVHAIGATVATATVTACVVNVAGIGIKSGATYIAGEKAEWFNDSVNSGLDSFNESIVTKTVGICKEEHKVLWYMQGLVGQGVTTLVNNIEDPSSIMEAGKTAANWAVSAWGSVKCAYDYISTFRASEKAECAGEPSEVPSE
jgi:hypothetical protein